MCLRQGYTITTTSAVFPHLQVLASPAQAGSIAVKDNIRTLERNIAENINANTRGRLDSAKAGAARVRRVVDVLAGDDDARGADAEGEVGQRGAAGEGVAARVEVVLGARDLRVVGADDGAGHVQQRGAGVGDAVDARRLEGAAADGVAGRGELPEALAGAHGSVGDRAGVLGTVDEAEVVAAG